MKLDESVPPDDGTRIIEVTATHELQPRKGSPQAVLRLVGTLTAEEAELIRKAVAEIRQVDASLWKKQDS